MFDLIICFGYHEILQIEIIEYIKDIVLVLKQRITFSFKPYPITLTWYLKFTLMQVKEQVLQENFLAWRYSVQKEKSSFRSLRLLMCPVVKTCHVILSQVSKQKFNIAYTKDWKQVLFLNFCWDKTWPINFDIMFFSLSTALHMLFKLHHI